MSEEYIQIGQILKNYRLKKKLSLEKISNRTKISIQNLNNLEKGDSHLIGGQFYQRSFIKTYIKALRIREKKILLLLDNALNNSDKEKSFSEKRKIYLEENSAPVITEKIPTIPIIFIAVLGLITIFLVNFLTDSDQSESVQYNEKLATIEPKSNVKLSKIKKDLVDEIENIKQGSSIKQTNINIDEIENYKLQNNENFFRQIIAKEDVWIEIQDDSRNILLATILKKDETFNLPNDKENIIISSSNAGALFLKIGSNNDAKLGSYGTILDSVDLNSLITNH